MHLTPTTAEEIIRARCFQQPIQTVYSAGLFLQLLKKMLYSSFFFPLLTIQYPLIVDPTTARDTHAHYSNLLL